MPDARWGRGYASRRQVRRNHPHKRDTGQCRRYRQPTGACGHKWPAAHSTSARTPTAVHPPIARRGTHVEGRQRRTGGIKEVVVVRDKRRADPLVVGRRGGHGDGAAEESREQGAGGRTHRGSAGVGNDGGGGGGREQRQEVSQRHSGLAHKSTCVARGAQGDGGHWRCKDKAPVQRGGALVTQVN